MIAIDINPSGGTLQPNNPVQKDNLLTVDLPGATLAPGPGNKLELKMPSPGIQSISLVKVGNQKLRLEILGDKTLPTLAWNASSSDAALFAVTPCPNGFIPVTPASTHGEGSARLMYDLDAQGRPYNIRVDQSGGNPVFDRWAIQSLQQRQYRFSGVLKDARLRLTYEVEGSDFQQAQQKRRLSPSEKQQATEGDRSK
jgi:TonB family protein